MKFKSVTLGQIKDQMDVYVKWIRFKGKPNEDVYTTKSFPLNLQTHTVDFNDEKIQAPHTLIHYNDQTAQFEENTILQIKECKKNRTLGQIQLNLGKFATKQMDQAVKIK